MKRGLFLLCLLCGTAVSLSGCIVLPAIEGFNQLGLSKADREKLLGKAVKDFHSELYWSDPMATARFIKPEDREKVLEELRKTVDGVRVVESKVQSMQFDESSEKADVRINLRAYKVPFYIVEDHILIEKWEFSLSDGWHYLSQKEVKK